MTSPTTSGHRVLLLHPHAATRAQLLESLRELSSRALAAQEAATASEGLRTASWFDPEIVLVDLGGDLDLACDAVERLRGPGRTIVGLVDPLHAATREATTLKRLVRAGVADFLTTPCSANELSAVLERVAPDEDPPKRGQILCVHGCKGGVGTTTLAVQIALMLAGSGEAGRVALCDGDLTFGDVGTLLGLSAPHDLADAAAGLGAEAAIATCLAEHPETRLRVLPRPARFADALRVTPEDLGRILLQLQETFDHVVVDTGSGLDRASLAAFDLAEKIFLVTEATTPGVLATERMLHALEELGTMPERLRIVIGRALGPEADLPTGTIAERIGRPVDYRIVEDRAVRAGAQRGTPSILTRPKSELADVIGRLADDAVRPVSLRSP